MRCAVIGVALPSMRVKIVTDELKYLWCSLDEVSDYKVEYVVPEVKERLKQWLM